MQILDITTISQEEVIQAARAVLDKGGLLIFPTETTYGAGVDATNPAAVEKLLNYKSRREGKPLSIALPTQAAAEQYVELTEQARALYAQFLPGPLTVVSRYKAGLAPGVASEFGTVGVRIPDYPLLLELLRQFGRPVTATSANGSGKKRPYSVKDIMEQLSDAQKSLIDLVLDAGTLPPNPPSTVIDTTLSTPVTLRAGELTFDAARDTELICSSETETRELAGRLLLSGWDELKEHGLVLGLNGPLGAGKTVFAQGAAQFLGIPEQLKSPTYGYWEEYAFTRHNFTGTLVHADMWKVDTAEQLQATGLSELCQPGSVVVIEWWSQVAEWLAPELEARGIRVQQLQCSDLGAGVRQWLVRRS